MSATTTPFPKAVIFDAYGTLFDVHSVIAAAEQMFPGQGDALSQLWRQKQIEYTQLRTLADPAGALGAHYRPFWDITLDALRFSARKLHLTLGRAAEKRLMDEYIVRVCPHIGNPLHGWCGAQSRHLAPMGHRGRRQFQ